MVDVVVVGHVGRDLVLEVDDVPGPGAGAPVRARQERAGGAVNQAVAARQLGWSAALVAAVGDDDPGTAALADARADATEAEQLLGRSLDGTEDVVRAARNLVESGAGCAALATADADVLAWPEGHVVLPHLGSAPVDATGAGDAFVVGLVSALLEGHDVEIAGSWGAAAAALTVQHAGGRPDLSARAVRELAARSRPNSQELPR